MIQRRFLLKLVALLLLIAALIAAAGLWAFRNTQAQRSGELTLSGLTQPVTVYYDAWGVPHINAGNDADAYRALGYLHAQDRLFQMDLLRRIGAGRLSELFGHESFATDRFFRTLGISRYARDYAERLESQPDAAHVKLIKAYQDGINQYIDSGRMPPEYRLLLTSPDYFTLPDIAHVMGYMAYSFAEAFKTDALVDHVRGTLGERHMRDLVPGWPTNRRSPVSPPSGQISALTPVLEQLAQVERYLPAGQFMGSNAWAVNGSRSQSGMPMLANDPHIGFAIPAVWYEAHIRTPEHEVYGHFLAGLPFALLGHTRHHSWGLTMLMNDEVDFYRERVNPDNAREIWDRGRWKALQQHEEVIRIRGQEDRLVRMYSSRRGPIINDQPGGPQQGADRRPVSLFWTFLDPQSDSTEAFHGFSRAESMAEFEEAAAKHWSPGLNVIYADVENNIAKWTIGRIKSWPDSNNGFALLSGAAERDEFMGYQPFSANPKEINPRSGQIWSANNPPGTSNPRRVLPGYYAPADRADRIAELLDVDRPLNLLDFKAMQMDNRRPRAQAMVADVLPLLRPELVDGALRQPAARAAELLAQWDGSFDRNSVGATIFQRWEENLMRALFADELGAQYEFFRNTNMAQKSLAQLFWTPASPWWDNREQPTRDGRQATVEYAWAQTIESLAGELGSEPDDWRWSRVASLQHTHPLDGRLPFAGRLSTEPVAIDGGRETLNNMRFPLGEGSYQVETGPSTRRLIDLADVEAGLGINPLGQSGNPLDRHYADQAEAFNEGRYRAELFDWQAIEALPDRLELKPSGRRPR
ncbi:penicillin acylase family protein [Halopseudomonas nanhaiensis]|uniref:penicillin acylase family protein n=1 Tax=Halopseudomonas nanhaiensis TaxID=2830842 RepID=UPI001CBE474C|nr:penicillin acylase family protein [Halopseudomonas nanhaiensis]UAW99701.1 penicillin acylase family protein [Halopseudomonas nanhaiensis]